MRESAALADPASPVWDAVDAGRAEPSAAAPGRARGPRSRRAVVPVRHRGGVPAILRALSRLEDELNQPGDDPAFDHLPRPYNVNIGTIAAEAFDQDHPLVDALAAAHQRVHGTPPRRVVMGSTTDARYYLNQFGVPAVAYGPRSRNIHGTDEAVELASIVSGARALARFIAGFFAAGFREAGALAGGDRR